jgi:hypothetical protein
MSKSHSSKTGPKRKSLASRFWSKVAVASDDECWTWLAGCNKQGYGTISRGGRDSENLLAHRASWEILRGPVPDNLCVLHTCDNPACVNPKHLFLGTRKDNLEDMTRKGRRAYGLRHGAYTRPERRTYGDRNGSRLHPDRVARGSKQPGAKLSESIVAELRRRYKEGGVTYRELAAEFGVYVTVVQKAVTRATWAHV